MNRFLLGPTSLLLLWASVATAQVPTYLRSWPTFGALPLGLATAGTARLYMVDERGIVWMYAQTGTTLCDITSHSGQEGYGVAVLSDGTVVAAEHTGPLVDRTSMFCVPISSWSTGGPATYLAVDDADNVYVTEDISDKVQVFTKAGAFIREWPSPHPTGIAIHAGVVYVVGRLDGVVHSYLLDGTPVGSFAHGLCCPDQLAADAFGRLYAADKSLGQIRCFAADGTGLWTLGPNVSGYPYNPARFVSVTVSGDGTIFAGDYDHRRFVVLGAGPTPALRSSFGALKAHYR